MSVQFGLLLQLWHFKLLLFSVCFTMCERPLGENQVDDECMSCSWMSSKSVHTVKKYLNAHHHDNNNNKKLTHCSSQPTSNDSQYSKPRFYSGVLTAILGWILAVSFLEPLLSVGLGLATVALHTLALCATAVGMCLGVLLPVIMPGACLGVTLTTLGGFFFPIMTNLVYVCPIMVAIGSILSFK
jgi:hypothetical protein